MSQAYSFVWVLIEKKPQDLYDTTYITLHFFYLFLLKWQLFLFMFIFSCCILPIRQYHKTLPTRLTLPLEFVFCYHLVGNYYSEWNSPSVAQVQSLPIALSQRFNNPIFFNSMVQLYILLWTTIQDRIHFNLISKRLFRFIVRHLTLSHF